jgi:hypothetical protein
MAGYDVPSSMQGRSLVGRTAGGPVYSESGEQEIRDRLSGLGYLG